MAEEKREPMLLMDVGGNFIKYALTDGRGELWKETFGEEPSHADGTREEALNAFRNVVARGKALTDIRKCAVCIPDPFDYGTGTSWMEHKFQALYGQSLLPLFEKAGVRVSFVQDTVAYMLGEYAAGNLDGAERPCLVTLGTGVGFAVMREKRVVVNRRRVPIPILWNAAYREGITEDYVSTRAIQERYGEKGVSVRGIAEKARAGEQRARKALADTGADLGIILDRVTRETGADLIVIGGQIAKSADLLELRTEVPWKRAVNLDDSALRGLRAWQEMGQEKSLLILDE